MANEASQQSLHKVAGPLLMVAGVSYAVLSVILVISGGTLPASGEEFLTKLAALSLLMQMAMVLFIVKDLCILVAFPILALILWSAKTRTWLIASVVFSSVAMVLDIISGLTVLAYVPFASAYAHAPLAMRSMYLISADVFYVYTWHIETPFMVALLALAVFGISVSMIRMAFKTRVAYVGAALGITACMGGLLGFIQPALLLALWYIPMGFSLLHASGQRRAEV